MPNASRLIRLLSASVGPLLTRAVCQAMIWGPPAAQRAGERADLDGHLGVGHVIDQLGEERVRGVGVDDGVELADGRFPVSGHADLATRVAGLEQAHELFPVASGGGVGASQLIPSRH